MSTMHRKLTRSASLPNLHSDNPWNHKLDAAPTGNRAAPELPLPAELLDKIVYEAWSLPLTRDERIDLATALPLVSHTFLAIFTRIALTDVHITTPAFAQHYLKLVRPRSSFAADESTLVQHACQIAHRLCRSLTFHVAARGLPGAPRGIRLYADGDRAAEAVSATLYLLSLVPVFVPRLRTVALAYTDWGFGDVLDQCRLLPMPAQVAALELRYAFSSAKLRALADAAHRAAPRSVSMRWGMGGVRRLAVVGAPADFVATVAEMCPDLQTLEVDRHVEEDRTWEMPKGLRKLVLVDDLPPMAPTTVDWWQLARSTGGDASATYRAAGDIMPNAPWSRIIGRQRLRRICLRNNVEYHRAPMTAVAKLL